MTQEILSAEEDIHVDKRILYMVVFLFFAWGFTTVLLDTLIPRLKNLFALTYAEAMLTQFSFFLSYFLFSIPAAAVLSRVGYLRSIVMGLAIMSMGALLLYPAAHAKIYWGFLGALFVMAAGITLLQVAANPLISILGPERNSSARLTLAQAFNSLGTTLGPLIGAHFILRDASGQAATSPSSIHSSEALLSASPTTNLQITFVAIAFVLILLAILFWAFRRTPVPTAGAATDLRAMGRILRQPQLAWGAVCIFLYVGAEVSIGSVLVNYLTQTPILGVSAVKAGSLVSFYWGGAMVGRFIGSAVLNRVAPGLVLMICALGAGCLAISSAATFGVIAACAIISVGLCNSIMFPTIFSLAIDGLGADKSIGSGALCMAIVGGAVVPVLTGVIADASGLANALLLPAACYFTIATYGFATWNSREISPTASTSPENA